MSEPIDKAITWSLYATFGFALLNFFGIHICYSTEKQCKEYIKALEDGVEIDITQPNATKLLSGITMPKLVCVTGYLAPRVKDGEIKYLRHGDNKVETSMALAIEEVHYSKHNGKIIDDIDRFIMNSIKMTPMILSSLGNSKRQSKDSEVVSLHLSDIDVSKELHDQVTSDLLPRMNEIPRGVRVKLSKVKLNKGLAIVAPKAIHHGSFIRTDEFDLPRKEHTYDDYWSNNFKKAVQYIVPAFLNCSIIGNLSLDSDGKFCLTPHPLLGFIMFRYVKFTDLIKYYEESIASTASFVEILKKGYFLGLSATGFVAIVYIYRYFTKPGDNSNRSSDPPSSSSSSTIPNSECPICLESTMVNPVALVPCGHCYCKNCIEQYIFAGSRNGACCPVCKAVIQSKLRIYA